MPDHVPPPAGTGTTYTVRTGMDRAVDEFMHEYVLRYGYLPIEVLAELSGRDVVFVSRVLARCKEHTS